MGLWMYVVRWPTWTDLVRVHAEGRGFEGIQQFYAEIDIHDIRRGEQRSRAARTMARIVRRTKWKAYIRPAFKAAGVEPGTTAAAAVSRVAVWEGDGRPT
jgi:hypothetical protein